jgi:branched-chain amino acid transport system permease protein
MTRRLLFWPAVLLVLLGLQFVLPGVVGFYWQSILVLAGIDIILAVSLNLINGYTGQFSIGHAGFFMVGAYTSAALAIFGGPTILGAFGGLPQQVGGALLLLLSLAFSAILAGIAGLLVGIPSLRLRGDYLAIVTLGFGEIIRTMILNTESLGGARGLRFNTLLRPANSAGVGNSFFWVFLFVVITAVVIHRLVNSSYGRAFISIRDDEIAAEAMGVDTTRFKVMSFVISSMFAGVAGGLFAHAQPSLAPNSFLFTKSFFVIIMIVIGGLGSIEGAILGALIVNIGLEGLRPFGDLRLMIFSVALVIIMIYRPQGILGRWALFRARRRSVPGGTDRGGGATGPAAAAVAKGA